jgi:Xaa-Pro aminopeptidase
LWVGPRPGVEETSIRLDIKTASLSALPRAIEGITQKGGTIRSTPGEDRDLDELLRGHTSKAKNAALATALSELRLIKDDWEIDQLHQAVNATHRGFNDVIAEFGRATSERWLEGTFFRRARTDGNDIGYGSIVACGHHACTLHWMDNNGQVNDGELALLDMGVEGANLYTADVTRTVPISGTFSDTQRMVYEAVLEAQEAGIAATRAGASFTAPHQAAMRVLVQHLIKWGLLHTDIDDAMRTEMYRRYTLHGTSHMLGIDVHDCAQARNEFYRDGSLQPGMALTVEPGLYFQPDDATVPKHLRGIGVRIEDDVVVTTGDPLVLSAAIPKTVKGVEQWVRSARRRR